MKKSTLRSGALWLLFLMLLASRSAFSVYAQSPSDANLLTTLGQLRDASFDDKEKIIDQLAASNHPSVRAILTAFLQGRLYYRNKDMQVVLIKQGDEDSPMPNRIDPITLKPAGSASDDDLTKMVTNNRLRRVLQTTLARYGLSSA